MKLRRFIHSQYGKLIISFILGFGLSTLFRRGCKSKKCMTFEGPSLDDVVKQPYKYGNKCYTFEPNPVKCSSNKKIVRFA